MSTQSAPLTAIANNVVGCIDTVDETGIYGWAYDVYDTDCLWLWLCVDGRRARRFRCARTRADVLQAGHPRAEVGFHVEIPKQYFDGGKHEYAFETDDETPVCLTLYDGSRQTRRSFSFETFVDTEFYTKYYDDLASLSPQNALEHWKTSGRVLGRHPNPDSLLAELRTRGEGLPLDFVAADYRFLNGEIAARIESDWEAGLHYLKKGESEGRLYALSDKRLTAELYPGDLAAGSGDWAYASLGDMLARNGITSDAFIRYLNVSDYVTDNPGAGLRTKLQCIRHFVEEGRKECRPLSFDGHFNQTFVAELDETYAGLSPEECYLRWINEGVRGGIAPNRQVFLRDLRLSDLSDFPGGFDHNVYMARNPDLAGPITSRWAALRHFIRLGIAERRKGCDISEANYDLYRAAADHFSLSSQMRLAKELYETVLTVNPRDVLANRHYADCLLRLEEWYLAAQVYERTIDNGLDNIWSHINLVTCYQKLGLWEKACSAIKRISERRPGDRGMWRRRREVLRQAYDNLWAEAHALCLAGFEDAAREQGRRACDVISVPVSSPVANQANGAVKAVLIVADMGLAQCKLYRVDQKIEQLEAAGFSCRTIDYRTVTAKTVREIPRVDLAIFYRVPAIPDVMWTMALLRAAKIPIIFEIDDLMFDSDYFPDTFESYGGQISRAVYSGLVLDAVSLAASLRASDYAIGSTPALAAAMAPHVAGKQAFVHRNALGAAHLRSCSVPTVREERDKVYVFYGSGTKAHKEDFEQNLAGPLAQLLSEWEDRLRLVLMGYFRLPEVLAPYRAQIQITEPTWDVQTYWNILREMDIAVAVLKPGLVADAKSEIKWLEAGMLGIPSVVTATQTFDEVIDHGVNGLLVRKADDWYTHLNALIADRQKRLSVGQAARAAVLERYSIGRMSENIREIISTITVPKPARTRVLIVNVFFAPQSIGGATRVVADNIRNILSEFSGEFELEVFCTLDGGEEAYLPLFYTTDGVRVTAVSTPVKPHLERECRDERMVDPFEAVLDRFDPQLIHFHCVQRVTLSPIAAARKRGIPYVVTVHDGWWISDEQFLIDEYGTVQTYRYGDPLNEFARGGPGRLERMKLKQEYLRNAERVLAVSEPFAKVYRSCGFENVSVVANGVSELEILPRIPSEDGKIRLAHIGGASLHKGYNLVRSALFHRNFANLRLLVIDHAMQEGERRDTMWGSTPVTLQGPYPQSEVAELYRRVDVLLAPSVWPESYGLVVREALLSGCRVIASDRGAVSSDVTSDNGWVVDVSSVDSLIDVLQAINANPERYREPPAVRPNLRTSKAQARELVDVYRSLVRTAPRPSVSSGSGAPSSGDRKESGTASAPVSPQPGKRRRRPTGKSPVEQ